MFTIPRVSSIVAAFVIAVSGIVWTAVGDERSASQQAFAETAAADSLRTSLLNRESALRGFAQGLQSSFLEPYDEAGVELAAAADRARTFAGGEEAELAPIAAQERLAERWAGSANDAIIRLRIGQRQVGEQDDMDHAKRLHRGGARS